VAYLYFRHRERQRRLEIVHQERLAAMEKGIPLPEFPLDPPRVPTPPDPRALYSWPNAPVLWPLPLPIALLGIGLMLYYALASVEGGRAEQRPRTGVMLPPRGP
jgi:hypothetical protein